MRKREELSAGRWWKREASCRLPHAVTKVAPAAAKESDWSDLKVTDGTLVQSPSWVFSFQSCPLVVFQLNMWNTSHEYINLHVSLHQYNDTHTHTFHRERLHNKCTIFGQKTSHWQQHQSLGQKQTKTKFWQDNPKTFEFTPLLQSKDWPPHGGVKLHHSQVGFRMSVGRLEALLQMLIRGNRAAAS